MRFFKSFRLLHRRTKSEGDVPALLPASSSPTSLQVAHSTRHISQDTTHQSNPSSPPVGPPSGHIPSPIYAEPSSPFQVSWPEPYNMYETMDALKLRTFELETEVRILKRLNVNVKLDLEQLEEELSSARECLYAEMVKTSHLQRQRFLDSQHISKLELRFDQLKKLLLSIGLPQDVVDKLYDALDLASIDTEDILMNAIKFAVNQSGTPLASIKPIIVGPRTPEHYNSALTMTLSARRDLRNSKKTTKFWKRLAQEDARHAEIVTPSCSNLSSVHELLTPEREIALKELIARRQHLGPPMSTGGSLSYTAVPFDARSSTLTIQPATVREVNIPASLPTSSSRSTSSSGATAHLPYLSSFPQLASQSIKGELSPSASTYTTRLYFSRPARPSVLGEIDTNIPRFALNNAPESEVAHEDIMGEEEVAPSPMVSIASQELSQNRDRTSFGGHTHRRNPSVSSQRSNRSNRTSYRLSMASPTRSLVSAVTNALAENQIISPEHTTSLGHSRGSSDVSDISIPFDNSVFHSLVFGTNLASSPLSPADSSNADRHAGMSLESRFIEHINDSTRHGSMSTSTINSTGLSPCLSGITEESKESLFNPQDTPTTGPTTPSKTPGDTPTKSSRLPVLKHFRRLSISTPTTEALMNKIRAWSPPGSAKSRSSADSESPKSPTSPVKPSAIPVMNRRLTLIGRKLSMSSKMRNGSNNSTP